jgi:hypothetical protein
VKKGLWTKLPKELTEIPLDTFIPGTLFLMSYLVTAAYHVHALLSIVLTRCPFTGSHYELQIFTSTN